MMRNETIELVDIAMIIDEFISMKKMRNHKIKKHTNSGRKDEKKEHLNGSGGVKEKDIGGFYKAPSSDTGQNRDKKDF